MAIHPLLDIRGKEREKNGFLQITVLCVGHPTMLMKLNTLTAEILESKFVFLSGAGK